jgi:zinc transport system permease protein
MFAVAIAAALVSTIGGLCISYYADLASGATIVTLASVIFFVFFGIGQWRRRKN